MAHEIDPQYGVSPADQRTRRRRRRDRGSSLVEVVITISLMGVVLVAVMGAAAMGVRESARSRVAAKVETTLLNAADRINRAEKVCDYTIYATLATQSQKWAAGEATTELEQEHLVPNADPAQPGDWVSGACAISTPADLEVQRITVTIVSPDGALRRTIQVVKSDV